MSRSKAEQTLKNWQDRLAHFEYELSITSSPEQKFELDKNIEKCKNKILFYKLYLTIKTTLS